MNTPAIPPPTPDLELIRKAMREYQPAPRRVPFTNLKPFHDSIVELRGKHASYAVIAILLKHHGVNTSRARVAEYGRIVLEGGKRRNRRKRARNVPATPQSVSIEVPKAPPTVTPPVMNQVPTPSGWKSKFKSFGPRIARIRRADGSIAGESTPDQTP